MDRLGCVGHVYVAKSYNEERWRALPFVALRPSNSRGWVPLIVGEWK